MRAGVREDDGDGKENMPVAGTGNQTSSLLTQEHREKEMGEIKLGNILQRKEEKKKKNKDNR